jgi:hypothetical protein
MRAVSPSSVARTIFILLGFFAGLEYAVADADAQYFELSFDCSRGDEALFPIVSFEKQNKTSTMRSSFGVFVDDTQREPRGYQPILIKLEIFSIDSLIEIIFRPGPRQYYRTNSCKVAGNNLVAIDLRCQLCERTLRRYWETDKRCNAKFPCDGANIYGGRFPGIVKRQIEIYTGAIRVKGERFVYNYFLFINSDEWLPIKIKFGPLFGQLGLRSTQLLPENIGGHTRDGNTTDGADAGNHCPTGNATRNLILCVLLGSVFFCGLGAIYCDAKRPGNGPAPLAVLIVISIGCVLQLHNLSARWIDCFLSTSLNSRPEHRLTNFNHGIHPPIRTHYAIATLATQLQTAFAR